MVSKPDVSIHPAAELFPMMGNPEYQQLLEDIRKHGQREPVVFWRGHLIDGRNRVRACDELGIEYSECQIDDDDDPLSYILSHNLHRRHLTPSQRSMCAAKLANLPIGFNQHDEGPQICGASYTCDQAAALFKVSERSIESARKVLRDGSKELQSLVESNELSVNAAVQLIREVPDTREQSKLAKKGAKAVKDKLKEIKDAKPKRQDKSIDTNGRISLPDEPTASDVGYVDRWLERHDERPVVDRFKSLWSEYDATQRAIIRELVNELD